MSSEFVSSLFVRMSRMEPLGVDWAWDGMVPMGKLSLITGDPGVGKSLVALQVAAMMTRGESIPLDLVIGEPKSVPEGVEGPYPRGVLVLSAADDPQDTVLPRLIAAGADPSMVFFLKGTVEEELDEDHDETSDEEEEDDEKRHPLARRFRPFQLSRDLDKLVVCMEELSMQEIDVGLVVIDSIDRFIGASEKKSDRIDVVAGLADLAARSQAAVLVTANTSMKAGSRGGTAVYQELLNAARSVLMVAEDLEMPERKLVLPVKHNLIARPETVSFAVEEGVVRWEAEPVDLTVEEYLAQRKRKNPIHRDAGQEIERATMWLKEELGTGQVAAVSLRERASEQEISYGTLRRAFKGLEGKAIKVQDRWYWELPVRERAVVESVGRECEGLGDQGVEEVAVKAEKRVVLRPLSSIVPRNREDRETVKQVINRSAK
jgi:putative DNA primase/helicase